MVQPCSLPHLWQREKPVLQESEFISRGYEHICEDLRTLGCRIWQPETEDLRIYERK